MKFPKISNSKSSGGPQAPVDNQFTIFLFIIGLLMSVFVLVGNFGAIGFLPFGMIVAGVAIQWKLKVKSQSVSVTGFNTKTLTFIAGGLILVLTINYLLGTVLSVAFLQPPISAAAFASSAQYANFPVYVYTLLFAIAEEYLFRAVIMYWILNYMRNQFIAIIGSSLLWVIFHLFVYGSAPLVLAFVFFTGLIFGFTTLYSRSILVASTVHGINNVLAAGLTIIGVVV
jgi:membrane protease YdiL (CAAX protease family)